jgi:hypothetical protein
MKIGDFVRSFAGGPILEILAFLKESTVAVCRNVRTGVVSQVLVALLVLAGVVADVAHGHGPEEPPPDRVVVQPPPPAAIGSDGVIRGFLGLEDETGPPANTVQLSNWYTRTDFFPDEELPFPVHLSE